MKILQKATTPDGTDIQLEDWSEDYAIFPYGSTIAAYPRKHIRCRATLELYNYQEAMSVFDGLQKGNIHLGDKDFQVMERGGRRISFKEKLEKYMSERKM